MLRNKIIRTYSKIKKISAEEGCHIAIKKIVHSSKKYLLHNKKSVTKRERGLLLSRINIDHLTNDVERELKNGFIRPKHAITYDINQIPETLSKKIVQDAEHILQHKYRLYGHLDINIDSGRLLWRRDPLSGFIWPNTMKYHKTLYQKPTGTDIKNIWEIARFHFLSPLSCAYLITGEKKYAIFAHEKLSSFIENNIFLEGPNWNMPMESAIRLINWCFFLPLLDFFELSEFTKKKKITISLLEHLIYIRNNLEVSPSKADNHYLSNLLGIIPSKILFPNLTWAEETTDYAVKEFQREVLEQFYSSGINYEGSLAYHRLSSEIVAVGYALIKKMNLSVEEAVIERIQKIRYFTKIYSNTGKGVPVIGDNDSGIIVKFFPNQEENNHEYLIYFYAFLLGLTNEPNSFDDYLCTINFGETKAPYNRFAQKKGEEKELIVVESNGLVIAKCKNNSLFFNCLDSTSGHSHNDKLSIYPIFNKIPLFVDKGSFSYSGYPEKRNEDRSSTYHNAPVVNGWEQNILFEDDLFYNNGDAKTFTLTHNDIDTISIEGWHTGYHRFEKHTTIHRKILWDLKEQVIIISDWIQSIHITKKYDVKWCFLINPDWFIEKSCEKYSFESNNIHLIFDDKEKIGLRLIKQNYSPKYQQYKECSALIGKKSIRPGKTISFILRYN